MENLWVGMTGTGHYDDTDHLPKSWDQKYTQLYPHGKAKMNAILSLMEQRKATGPELAWWEDIMVPCGGDIAGVYTDVVLATAYNPGAGSEAAAGTVLYLKVDQDTVRRFRSGIEVMLHQEGDSRNDIIGKVVDTIDDGASSVVAVKLLQADGDGPGDAADCTYVFSIGDVSPEGSFPVASRAYERSKAGNYLQITQDVYDITRTADQSQFTTGSKKEWLQAQCLDRFNTSREWQYMFGKKSVNINPENGHPEYTTDGIVQFLKSGAADHIRHYHLFDGTSEYKGQTWLTKGTKFLNESMEMLFTYTDGSVGKKLALCGNGAISGLNELVGEKGAFQMTESTTTFGWSVWRWRSPFGDIDFMTYPLFNLYPDFSNSVMFLEPHNLKRWYLQKTRHKEVTPSGMDGQRFQYLAQDGLQCRYPKTMMWLTGVGLNNTQA